jgi:hypothetical protein
VAFEAERYYHVNLQMRRIPDSGVHLSVQIGSCVGQLRCVACFHAVADAWGIVVGRIKERGSVDR